MATNNEQTLYFSDAIKDKHFVSIYLTNGIRLDGFINSVDDESLLLAYGANVNLVFKHAIATVKRIVSSNYEDESRGNRSK